MSYGLKEKIKPSVLELQTRRENGENITLREFMAEKFPKAGIQHLYSENGINPNRTTFDELMQDENNKYLMVELTRDAILRGMGISQRKQLAELRQRLANLAAVTTDPNMRSITPEQFMDPIRVGQAEAAFFNDLIIQEVPVDSLTPTMPKIDLSKSKPKKIREGSKIELGTVSYKEKTVTVYEYGLGLEFSYNSLRYNRINLVPLYFEDLGMRMAALKNAELTMVALNGDQADGSESSAVIGVEDIAKGLQWFDAVRVFNRMKRLGRTPNVSLASENRANKWENMDEVKNRQQGTPLMANRRTAIPSNLDVYIGDGMPSTQQQFISTMLAFLQLTAQGVMLETDKVISKRMEEAYVTESVGYMNFQRDARITVDESLEFANNGFPEWFDIQR